MKNEIKIGMISEAKQRRNSDTKERKSSNDNKEYKDTEQKKANSSLHCVVDMIRII